MGDVITPLESGQEVGRSCHIVEFRATRDIHPGHDGRAALSYWDRIELPTTVDVLVV
jgi:cleavage and polyadenylation specificity factor subunit 3